MSDSSPAPFSDPAGTWNSRFDSDTYLFGTTPNDWLREHAGQSTPGQRILCVADGEGRNSVDGFAVDEQPNLHCSWLLAGCGPREDE